MHFMVQYTAQYIGKVIITFIYFRERLFSHQSQFSKHYNECSTIQYHNFWPWEKNKFKETTQQLLSPKKYPKKIMGNGRACTYEYHQDNFRVDTSYMYSKRIHQSIYAWIYYDATTYLYLFFLLMTSHDDDGLFSESVTLLHMSLNIFVSLCS